MMSAYATRLIAISRQNNFRAITASREKLKPEMIIPSFLNYMEEHRNLFLNREFRKIFIASLYLNEPKFISNPDVREIFSALKLEKESHFHFFHFSHEIKDSYQSLIGILTPDDEDIGNAFQFTSDYLSKFRIKNGFNLEKFRKDIHSIQNHFEKLIENEEIPENQRMKKLYCHIKERLEHYLIQKIAPPEYSIEQTENGVKITKKNPPFFYLSLSGGGAKGSGYYGVIEAIEKIGRRKTLKQICGSSAGSEMASLIAFGIKSDEIRKIYQSLNLKKLTSNDAIIKTLNPILSKHIASEYEDIIKRFPLTYEERERVNLFKTKYKLNMTPAVLFEDLAILKKYLPEEYKDLLITGTCEDGKLIIFSAKNSPKISIAEAVAASCSLPIPLLTQFTPVLFENKKIRDGGIKDNSPIDYFETTATRENTLAVFFDTREMADRIQNEEGFFILKKDFSRKIIDKLTGHNTYSNWNSSYYRLKKLDIDKSAVNILYHSIGILDFDGAKKYQTNMAEYAKNSILTACSKREFSQEFKSYSDLFFSFSSDELNLILKDEVEFEGIDSNQISKEWIQKIIALKTKIKLYFHNIVEEKTNPCIDSFTKLVKDICVSHEIHLSNEAIANYIYKLISKNKNILNYFKENINPSIKHDQITESLKNKIYQYEFKKLKRHLIENIFSPAAFKHPSKSMKGDATLAYLDQLRKVEFDAKKIQESMDLLYEIEKKYEAEILEIENFEYEIMDLPAM